MQTITISAFDFYNIVPHKSNLNDMTIFTEIFKVVDFK